MIRNKPLSISILFSGILIIVAFFGAHLPFVDSVLSKKEVAIDQVTLKINKPPFPPSRDHLLGTDNQGRDLLSLIVLGTKDTLMLVLSITLIRFIIAVPLGMLAHTVRRPFYWLLSGWNYLSTSIPIIFILMFIFFMPITLATENRTIYIILIIAILEVGRVAYLIQREMDTLSKSTFMESGVMIGNNQYGLIRRYYFPYLAPTIFINFALEAGRVLLLIGQLGLFYIFIKSQLIETMPNTFMHINMSLDWATQLAQSRNNIRTPYIWTIFFPVLAITFTVITFNLLGEGLRRHFEHSLRY